MIRMVSGSTRVGGKVYTPKSGAIQLESAAEARLVQLGVAVYAAGSPPTTDPAPVEAAASATAETTAEQAEEGAAAPSSAAEANLDEMSFKDLKALAQDMDIDTRNLKSKASLAAAIREASEAAPTLGTDSIIV